MSREAVFILKLAVYFIKAVVTCVVNTQNTDTTVVASPAAASGTAADAASVSSAPSAPLGPCVSAANGLLHVLLFDSFVGRTPEGLVAWLFETLGHFTFPPGHRLGDLQLRILWPVAILCNKQSPQNYLGFALR